MEVRLSLSAIETRCRPGYSFPSAHPCPRITVKTSIPAPFEVWSVPGPFSNRRTDTNNVRDPFIILPADVKPLSAFLPSGLPSNVKTFLSFCLQISLKHFYCYPNAQAAGLMRPKNLCLLYGSLSIPPKVGAILGSRTFISLRQKVQGPSVKM